VNTDLLEIHDMIVQAGTFGEHAFTEATLENAPGVARQPIAVNAQRLQIRLGLSAYARLRLGVRRFVHWPSYEFPAFE
jgi:hypothetical protein